MFASINRSVRYKIVAVILATTLAALLVSTVALLTYEARSFRQFLISDATTQADIIATTSVPALEFNDPEAAAANLSLLDTRASVIAAAIYTSDGTLFAKYVRKGRKVDFPSLIPAPGTQIVGDTLRLFHPIIHDEQLIGTVFLLATNDLPGRLRGYVLILATVMLGSLLIAAVISFRLQRGISAPVLAVSAVARKVIEDRDFTLRAQKTTDDEIGVLVDSFNAMLSEVGQTTEALKATNRRLQKETEERRAAEGALRLADRRKDEFLATLAHELRNPLAPMVNALSMLHADDPTGSTRRRAEEILGRQLKHLVRLVDDLLDVSRITRGKLALNLKPVELHAIVASAVDTVAPIIESRRHELAVELPDEPIYLHADALRLSQVLSNLLNNSAKYTEPGGHVRLGAKPHDDRVEITVADDGIGIPPETLPTIFQMFTQGDGSMERAQGGLGVGLALSKRLIELHGGTIHARSEGPGKGATFVLRIPTIPAPVEAEEPESLAGPAKRAHALRILLVDDNVDFVTSLALLLEESGHEVRVAHDAAAALQAAAELHPEIAFLDLGLPGVSGYELAARLRESPAGADTVLVALSGWGQPQDRVRSKKAGFVRHLVKPVEFHQLLAVLETLATEA
ncbi:MAG TPA: ATP-binding protein [Gammaproteobacteria bacterium]|nr:ATP-binding protein [Gammaproteobacteria bacterium]